MSLILSEKMRSKKMSQQPEQNVTVYSDKASMANESNGDSTLQVVTPQAIEEPEMGLAP